LTTIPLDKNENLATTENNKNEYIFLPQSYIRRYANRPQIMLKYLKSEHLSDYEHTETSSNSNESNDETFVKTFENYLPPDFNSCQEEEK